MSDAPEPIVASASSDNPQVDSLSRSSIPILVPNISSNSRPLKLKEYRVKKGGEEVDIVKERSSPRVSAVAASAIC